MLSPIAAATATAIQLKGKKSFVNKTKSNETTFTT